VQDQPAIIRGSVEQAIGRPGMRAIGWRRQRLAFSCFVPTACSTAWDRGRRAISWLPGTEPPRRRRIASSICVGPGSSEARVGAFLFPRSTAAASESRGRGLPANPIAASAVHRSRTRGEQSTVFSGFCAPRALWCGMPERDGVRTLHPLEQAGGVGRAFKTLASLRPPADEEHAIGSIIVRAHQHAASVKGNQDQEALRHSRGGFSTKMHLRTNAKVDPLTFDVTGGEAHGVKRL
jgi:hypothetical protein